MEVSSQPERLNDEGFAAFAGRAAEDAPVVMLNLLAFKPEGGRERYEEYGEATAPLLEKIGGRIIFFGPPRRCCLAMTPGILLSSSNTPRDRLSST